MFCWCLRSADLSDNSAYLISVTFWGWVWGLFFIPCTYVQTNKTVLLKLMWDDLGSIQSVTWDLTVK